MILFFDTETTGLPRNWKAPVSDLQNWPRIVQLAWLAYEPGGELLSDGDRIIKPVGFTISREASAIHGISMEKALAEGQDLQTVLDEFETLLQQATCLVAHNMSFDEKIVGAELLRAGRSNLIPAKKKICTMQVGTDYCRIPGNYGYKWPKLSELHRKLFGQNFAEAHNAAADIQATAKCFWELRRLGVV